MPLRKTFFILLTLFLIGSVILAAPLATLVFKQGDVEIFQAKTKKWVKAAPDAPLELGDIIVTKEGAKAELEFSIGDVVRLAELSSLEIKDAQKKLGAPKKTLLSLIRGEVLSKVEKLKGGREFVVETPVALAAVKGTVYLVRYDENDQLVDIQVLEGEVTVQGKEGEPVVIPPNKAVAVVMGGAPQEPRELSEQERGVMQTWLREREQRASENLTPTINFTPTTSATTTPSVTEPIVPTESIVPTLNPVEPTQNMEPLFPTESATPTESMAPTESTVVPSSELTRNEEVTLVVPKVDSLTGEIESDLIVLSWRVAPEQNLGGFVLYRDNVEVARFSAGQSEYKESVPDLPGVQEGKTYRYVLKATQVDGTLEPEGKDLSLTIPDTTPLVESIFVNGQSLDSLGTRALSLQRDDLSDGKIKLNGRASQEKLSLKNVEVSLDGGSSWLMAEGTTGWSYEFTPLSEMTYEIQVRAENSVGIKSSPGLLDQLSVTYYEKSNAQILSELLSDIVRYYNSADAQGMLAIVSDSYYGGKTTLQNELERTFSTWSEISFSVGNLSVDIASQTQATLSFSWSISYTDGGVLKSQSGSSQMLLEKEDSWKWKSTSGDRVLIAPEPYVEPGGAMPPEPPGF